MFTKCLFSNIFSKYIQLIVIIVDERCKKTCGGTKTVQFLGGIPALWHLFWGIRYEIFNFLEPEYSDPRDLIGNPLRPFGGEALELFKYIFSYFLQL